MTPMMFMLRLFFATLFVLLTAGSALFTSIALTEGDRAAALASLICAAISAYLVLATLQLL